MQNLYKFSFLIFSFLILFFIFAQYTLAYTCPNYEFKRDLRKGDTDPDVQVMQEILNLDKRTTVAYSGAGSKGNETNFFGIGTREALKRFQALFIEYIGIANGKFGPKTRVSMNAVCKGDFFTKGTGGVYDTTPKDTIPPVIALAGPTEANIDTPFRVFLGANEPVKTPGLDGLIIDGATADNLRKISSTTFSFLVTPNQDVKDKITLQWEADKVADLAGNTNEEASNEWDVYITDLPVATDTATDSLPFDLSKLLLPTATSTDCSNVTVDISDYTNPCYGRAPFSNASNTDQQPPDDSSMMQMLAGLLQALAGLAKGGGSDGGSGGADSQGDCSGLKTKDMAGKRGIIVGTWDDTLVPGEGKTSFVVDKIGPPAPVYGEKDYKDPIACKKSCKGECLGGCCNPGKDRRGMPVVGSLLKGKWNGDI